jgi:cytochrome c oxidase assembly protein Cox11
MMNKKSVFKEKRIKPRCPALSEHMVVFSFPGVPLYQLKAKDISENGIGVIVKPDSKFLNLIEIGQEMNVELLAPQESRHMQGVYSARIAHITANEEGRFKGHMLVGLELKSKIGINL